MRYLWANSLLLLLVAMQFGTGYAGLVNGSESSRWMLWLHGIGAYGLLLSLPWKGAIVRDSLGRSSKVDLRLLVSLSLALLLSATLLTGLLWTFGGRRLVLQYSVITLHIILAIPTLALMLWHAYARKNVLRSKDVVGRRALLRLGGITIAGAAAWLLADWAIHSFGFPGAERRFTGSYRAGALDGEFPSVSWLTDNPTPIDVGKWQLILEGEVERPLRLTYSQVEQMATDSLLCTIDCTGGWFSMQTWQGVRVGRLLAMAGVKPDAQSVVTEGVTGYSRRFSLEEMQHHMLALRVAGRPLSHEHGFPARLVAPDHRGFEWVKWVSRIRVERSGRFLQPPLPLQ